MINVPSIVSSCISIVVLSLFAFQGEAIVNGISSTHPGTHPAHKYLGSLQMRYAQNHKRHRCTTSLVSWHQVMTAAHCLIYQVNVPYIIEKIDFTEHAGEIVMGSYSFKDLNTIKRACLNVSLHPKYERIFDYEPGAYDLGVITLQAPFPLSFLMSFLPYVKPLERDQKIEEWINQGTLRCSTYGFGTDKMYRRMTEHYCVEDCIVIAEAEGPLRFLNVSIMPYDDEKCCEIFSIAQEKSYCRRVIHVKNGLRCTESTTATFVTAPGDEGGPVICLDPEQHSYFAYGIYLGKVKMGNPPNPEVFANITAIREAVSALVTLSKAIFTQANYLVTFTCTVTVILEIFKIK